jgi:hypothetical protein
MLTAYGVVVTSSEMNPMVRVSWVRRLRARMFGR